MDAHRTDGQPQVPPPAAGPEVRMLPGARPRTPQSLRDIAYGAVKHRIATLGFRPGEYLSETYLSAILGLGRTPVHQALDRLALEGLVDVIPRKGALVRPIDPREALEIIEVRLVNEIHCVRLAALHADADDIRHLTDILAQAAQWMLMRKTEQLMLLDRKFHAVLAAASRNAVLGECLTRLHDRSLRFWFVSLDTPGHHATVQAQHEAILAAIRDRDVAGAEEAMRAHVEAFRRNVAQFAQGNMVGAAGEPELQDGI